MDDPEIPSAAEMRAWSEMRTRTASTLARRVTQTLEAARGNGKNYVVVDNFGNDPKAEEVAKQLRTHGYRVTFPYRDGSVSAEISWAHI